MDELRRRHLIVPGPFIVEQMVAAVTALAERHVAHQLTLALLPAQREALDALLAIKEGTSMSVLAWVRHPLQHHRIHCVLDQFRHPAVGEARSKPLGQSDRAVRLAQQQRTGICRTGFSLPESSATHG